MFKFNQKKTLGNKLKFKQGLFNINFPNIYILKLNYLKSRKMKSMTSIFFGPHNKERKKNDNTIYS